MGDITEGDLNGLRDRVAYAVHEFRDGNIPCDDVAEAIDALIRAHLAAVKDEWLRSAGVLVKKG